MKQEPSFSRLTWKASTSCHIGIQFCQSAINSNKLSRYVDVWVLKGKCRKLIWWYEYRADYWELGFSFPSDFWYLCPCSCTCEVFSHVQLKWCFLTHCMWIQRLISAKKCRLRLLEITLPLAELLCQYQNMLKHWLSQLLLSIALSTHGNTENGKFTLICKNKSGV